MKRLIIISSVLVTLTGATAFALTRPTASVGADEKPPIVQQVENHEQRITDLEDKTDKTQTQVNQNSADIEVLQHDTNTPRAAQVDEVKTPVSRPSQGGSSGGSSGGSADPTPAPAPTPAPQIDPWYTTNVEFKLYDSTVAGRFTMRCVYSFHNGQVGWYASTVYLDAAGNVRYTTRKPSCGLVTTGQVASAAVRANLRFDTPQTY